MNIKQFKKLNIGICGCGYWASNIIKSLEEENFESVYVYDFDKKKLNNIKSKFSFLKVCRTFNDLTSLRIKSFFVFFKELKIFVKENISLYFSS